MPPAALPWSGLVYPVTHHPRNPPHSSPPPPLPRSSACHQLHPCRPNPELAGGPLWPATLHRKAAAPLLARWVIGPQCPLPHPRHHRPRRRHRLPRPRPPPRNRRCRAPAVEFPRRKPPARRWAHFRRILRSCCPVRRDSAGLLGGLRCSDRCRSGSCVFSVGLLAPLTARGPAQLVARKKLQWDLQPTAPPTSLLAGADAQQQPGGAPRRWPLQGRHVWSSHYPLGRSPSRSCAPRKGHLQNALAPPAALLQRGTPIPVKCPRGGSSAACRAG
mmetsp:Transcript_40212/g.105567  ORF Transcript_40212/g.105567 Transcript_40212/m.105567 type:complete len:274 (-) Transcript_40212:713-1534(-)